MTRGAIAAADPRPNASAAPTFALLRTVEGCAASVREFVRMAPIRYH